MTGTVTAVCEAPAFRLTDLRPAGTDPGADRVERILGDRHDEQDNGRAVRRLQKVRPDLGRHSVESFIGALLWYAQEVQIAWHGPRSSFDVKVADYETCLLGFVHGGAR